MDQNDAAQKLIPELKIPQINGFQQSQRPLQVPQTTFGQQPQFGSGFPQQSVNAFPQGLGQGLGQGFGQALPQTFANQIPTQGAGLFPQQSFQQPSLGAANPFATGFSPSMGQGQFPQLGRR